MKRDSIYAARVTAFRRSLLEHALTVHGGNRTHAARSLGIPRTYFVRLIRDHGLVPAAATRRTT